MDPRIGEVRPLYGPRSVADRREKRQDPRAFREALDREDADEGTAGDDGPDAHEPTARALQPRPRIVRKKDDDGMVHVDILA